VAFADALLRIAERGLYRPLWSARIIAETIDAIKEVHPTIPPGRIQQRFAEIDTAFADACVEWLPSLKEAVTLPDPDDRHVVAAAVHGMADAIVTANVRDYPLDVLEPLNITVIHPDAFLLDQLDLAPRIVLDVLRTQASQYRRSMLTPIDLIALLARAGVSAFADEAGRQI
jgi:predicted nucleic acid-binding protein